MWHAVVEMVLTAANLMEGLSLLCSSTPQARVFGQFPSVAVANVTDVSAVVQRVYV
jgi:hypothetical protein